MGEVIERAAALLDRAEPGEVTLDGVTAGLLDSRFEVVEQGDVRVLKAAREVSLAPRTLLGRPIPCVGREKELGILDAVSDACFDEPRAQAVLLVGPAGVGKSRVRDEFLRRLRARDEDARIWIGRGDPMRAGSPFGLVGQALRTAFGLVEGAPDVIRRPALRAAIERHVGSLEAPRLARFLGDPARRRCRRRRRRCPARCRAERSDPHGRPDAAGVGGPARRRSARRHPSGARARGSTVGRSARPCSFVDRALRNLAEYPLMVLAARRARRSTTSSRAVGGPRGPAHPRRRARPASGRPARPRGARR